MSTENRERFEKLANRRVNNAIKHIRLIGNLSNKSNYKYEKSDVDKIFIALEKEVEHCRERFFMNFKTIEKFDINQ